MFFLVCFDISDDKKRYRAVKVLKAYGVRVQKSVFECPNLTEHRFVRMKEQLDAVIDHSTDTFRFYFLCRECVARTEFSGIGEPPVTVSYRII
ncbi:CRISPR-associated endonuclease Cas2 [Desulfonema ishimotonii]|uniref:CRISPR-associated endoribonuclease Cas2 n=1 Tax=Desulfonema ishimotonii TaxID=45657 RepID=A0A401G1Q9_9BACT|nr:CRISPR-associated endonuclease Cas2 [Desulfonema ishimotonii]